MKPPDRKRSQRKSVATTLVCVAALADLFLSSAAGATAREATRTLEATVTVDATRPGDTISPLLYGTNINHVGMTNGFERLPKTKEEYEKALTKWFSYLPLVEKLGPTIIRFPGGLAANGYIWFQDIGPYEGRPLQEISRTQSGSIGTDEFLAFCEKLGAQAMITVNVNRASGMSALKTLTDENYQKNAAIAADWVEYCNAPNDGSNPRGGTDWAAVRAKNGHPQPYGVKYWELGNELFDLPLDWYKKAIQLFSREMKAVDPTIQIGVISLPSNRSKEKYTQWFRQILAECGDRFDFWIHHTYTPGTSGKINGFLLSGPGASITVPISFSKVGDCSLCYTAQPVKGGVKVVLSLDGKILESKNIVFPFEYCTRFQAPAGEHRLKVSVESGNGVYLYHMMKRRDASGEGYLDLKNSPELYYVIVAGASQSERSLWPLELTGGKPVCITEYNSHYELAKRPPMLGQVYGLREALNIAQYLQFFARKGFPVATQWLLYGDMYGFGLIEGVGIDTNKGGEVGRRDPRPRPSYYILKLYREHLLGRMLPVQVESASFHVGPPGPFVAMGFVGNQPMDVPYVNAVAALSDEGKRVALLVNNLHYEEEFNLKVRVKGFSPSKDVRHFAVVGADSWTNNEPEECPSGDCVKIVEKQAGVNSAGEIVCTLPPHSASALILQRK